MIKNKHMFENEMKMKLKLKSPNKEQRKAVRCLDFHVEKLGFEVWLILLVVV